MLEFEDYGKMFITGNKMSPDSFVQMAMILAYYRLYGDFVCAYEPVLMKRFLHGRTEAMRSATQMGKLFVECWCSSYTSKQDKIQHLRDAVAEHSNLVKEAAKGGGVDRHLFALKCIAAKHELEVRRGEEQRDQLGRVILYRILTLLTLLNSSLVVDPRLFQGRRMERAEPYGSEYQ